MQPKAGSRLASQENCYVHGLPCPDLLSNTASPFACKRGACSICGRSKPLRLQDSLSRRHVARRRNGNLMRRGAPECATPGLDSLQLAGELSQEQCHRCLQGVGQSKYRKAGTRHARRESATGVWPAMKDTRLKVSEWSGGSKWEGLPH